MVALLFLRPFECIATGAPPSDTADCCLKGKCAPTASSDACCKNSVPDRDRFVPSKAAEHSSPLISIVAVCVPALAPGYTFRAFADPARHPPLRLEL